MSYFDDLMQMMDRVASGTATPMQGKETVKQVEHMARWLELGVPREVIAANPAILELSEADLRTQRCMECQTVISFHPDARWRFKLHIIRCFKCAQEVAKRTGCFLDDAYYVE